MLGGLTNLDVAAGVQENVVALDVTVDNVLRVEMLQTLASLQIVWVSRVPFRFKQESSPRGKLSRSDPP